MPRHYQPFVSQIGPTLGTLPNLSSDLAKPAAPPVTLKYARPDFVNQVRPTLAMLPRIAAGVAESAPNAQPQKFERSNFASPDKFGIIASAIPTIASWTSTLGSNAIVMRYAAPDFVAQVRPTLETLPNAAAFLAYLSPSAQPQKFDRGGYSAPDKFGIVIAVAPAIAGWTAVPGLGAIILRYAQTFIAGPDKSLAALSVIPSMAAWASTAGLNAQPQDFDRGSIVGLDKAAATSAPSLLAAWTSTDARPAMKSVASRAEAFAAPVRTLPAVIAPSWVSAWTPTPGRSSFNKYAQSEAFSWRVFSSVQIGPFVAVAKGFNVSDTLQSVFNVTETLAGKVTASVTLSSTAAMCQAMYAKGFTSSTSLVAADFVIVATP